MKGNGSESGPCNSNHGAHHGNNVPSKGQLPKENINEWLESIQKKIKRPGFKGQPEGSSIGDAGDAELMDVINQLFIEHDAFSKGFLDLDDFRELLVKNTGKKFSEKEVKDLLAVADRNFDKVIDKHQLKQFYLMLIKQCKTFRKT